MSSHVFLWSSRVAARLAQRPRELYLFLVVLACAVLAPIFSVGMLCDDFQYWLRSHLGQTGLEDILAIQGGRNRPLTTALLVGLLGSFEQTPWLLGGFRLLHHAANAVLVGAIVQRTWAPRHATVVVSSIAFLVWGSHAEVYWQSSLHDVAAASFALAALLAATGSQNRRSIFAVAAFSFAAYWSKESAWCLPFVLLAFATQQEPSKGWSRLIPAGAAAGAFAVYFSARMLLVGNLWGDVVPGGVRTGIDFVAMMSSVSKQLFRSLLPGWIKSASLIPVIKPVIGVMAGAVAVMLAGAVLVPRFRAMVSRASRAPLFWVAVAYCASLGPVMRLSVSLENTENSRYLYLPTAFVAILFGLCWQKISERAPRVSTVALLLVLSFQAASLHAIGWNWILATQAVKQYEGALARLVEENPQATRFILTCVPDNNRGAFSARNVSPNLVASIAPHESRRARVLATRYARGKGDPGGCAFAVQGDALVVTDEGGKHTLTHPRFNDRINPIREGEWSIEASELQKLRANELLIRFSRLSEKDVVAVYDGRQFHTADMRGTRP